MLKQNNYFSKYFIPTDTQTETILFERLFPNRCKKPTIEFILVSVSKNINHFSIIFIDLMNKKIAVFLIRVFLKNRMGY
jgi:hypothetical protein